MFDTAFHQTLPKKAYMYAIPYEYYDKYKVRKYGAHGTSHRFVSKRVAEVMNKPIEDLKILVCHLGQGASLCAVKGGKSIETTMGLTPLAGVPMGTRSGDIDPSIAGIGENGIEARKDICNYLEFFGVKIDEEKNNCRGEEVEISADDSKVKVYVIPTNEELMIARDTRDIVLNTK